MLGPWIDGLLPGARSVRAPLVAGILWTLFLWILLADVIPHPDEAQGWPAQAYGLVSAAGPVPTSLIVAVLIFVLGAVTSVATEPLAAAIGRGAAGIGRRVEWQRHARERRRALIRDTNKHQLELEALPAPSGDESAQRNRAIANNRRRIEQQLGQSRASLDEVNTARWKVGYIPDSAEMRKALGQPPAKAGEGLERQLITNKRYRSIDQELQERKIDAALQDVDTRSKGYAQDFDAADELAAEMQPDPLDALRALDEALYLELDRERAEHDLRLAASVPVVALAGYGAVVWTPWLTILSVLGVVVFIRSALARSIERSRVLTLISLRGLETEALRDAAIRGRDNVRTFVVLMRQEEAEAEAAAADVTP